MKIHVRQEGKAKSILVNYWVSPAYKQALEQIADKHDVSESEFTRRAVRYYDPDFKRIERSLKQGGKDVSTK